MARRPSQIIDEPEEIRLLRLEVGSYIADQEYEEMVAEIENHGVLNQRQQDRVRRARDCNGLVADWYAAMGIPAGDVEEDMIKINLPLAENLEKIITLDAYREILAKSQSSEGAAGAGESGDRVSYLFQDLQLEALQNTKGNVEEETLKEGILILEGYLNGKKKGKDKIKSAFSLIAGEAVETWASYYFLKIDSNLLEKVSRTFGEDALIKATLKIKRANGVDNSQGALTSVSGRARPGKSGDVRHHPYQREGLSSECGDEMLYLIEGVIPGEMVSKMLDPSSAGMKLAASAPNASANYTLVFDEKIDNIVKRSEENSCSGNVHFFLNVCIESMKMYMAKPIEKVQLETQQVLQDMYELDDSTKEVTIVASNGAGIKCHRNILMAQIPSFRTMLSPDRGMAEAQTGRIELNENSEDGLREFIRFLYGFEVNLEGITSDMALELFQLGNKYQVKKLDDAMKNFLCGKKIDFYKVDTILELYFIARNVDCLEELRTHALTEMSKLSRDALEESDYFKSLCSMDQVDLLFVLLEWNK